MTGDEDSSRNSGPDSGETSAPAENQAANPAALTVEQLARLLGIDAEKVLDHVAAGAPVGPGQRVNLVHYAAWLNKEMGRTDGD